MVCFVIGDSVMKFPRSAILFWAKWSRRFLWGYCTLLFNYLLAKLTKSLSCIWINKLQFLGSTVLLTADSTVDGTYPARLNTRTLDVIISRPKMISLFAPRFSYLHIGSLLTDLNTLILSTSTSNTFVICSLGAKETFKCLRNFIGFEG
jgi:hypothetical protein